ncbi:uncharacterized protein LOC116849203 [Odontomachus brunneus]|uniref:uncharacterized protein LOC116849203 n=1 Tax=Odontomachus brunneus TaxID=486640 RepID=UPI0013F2447C|nr:uncharacterized protein LOC116849203 [Odontomachus brunneus]
MVRRSVLVYDLLRTEQPSDGFSQKEILTHISSKYDIAASKTLQRDVALALRCGLDFGILAKKRNKFRFDPELHQTASSRRNITRRSTRTKKRTRSSGKKVSGGSTATKGRRQRRRRPSTRGKARKQSVSVPRPKLPKPPSWSPKRRYLSEEPIPKVIKHS